MTFTTKIKEEISKSSIDRSTALAELSAFVKFDAQIIENKIRITIENASVARRIFRLIKEFYTVNISLTVRNQKRFRIKQIYILEIKEQINLILNDLCILKDYKQIDYLLDTKEEQISFIKGLFLACGSINDPATSGYHMEFVVKQHDDSLYIKKLLNNLGFDFKVLKRSNRYMIYIKSAEDISDIIKMFNAINSLFYFEDIRIYRDHKNMVNRLNNCDIANQDKTIKASLEQIENINYLKENDLFTLLDEKVVNIANYRQKYPEVNMSQLANIISLETGKSITKSGINHAFIKIRELVKKHKNKSSH